MKKPRLRHLSNMDSSTQQEAIASENPASFHCLLWLPSSSFFYVFSELNFIREKQIVSIAMQSVDAAMPSHPLGPGEKWVVF